MKELKIIAKITSKPEYKEEILKAIYKIVDETRKESGNISYELHQNINDEFEYTIFEVWQSQEAIDMHNETIHFQEFKKAIDGKINNLAIDIIKKIY